MSSRLVKDSDPLMVTLTTAHHPSGAAASDRLDRRHRGHVGRDREVFYDVPVSLLTKPPAKVF